MRDGLRVVDADAHVIEPHSMWTDYLAPEFRDRAPKPVGLTFGFELDGMGVNLPEQWSPASTQAAPAVATRHDSHIANANLRIRILRSVVARCRAVTAHPRALVCWRSDSDGAGTIKPEEGT